MALFKDTLNHKFEINDAQAAGNEIIVCPDCGWRGTTLDGGTEVLGDEEPSTEAPTASTPETAAEADDDGKRRRF